MLTKESKILLTGASGFLGSYISDHLDLKYEVVTLGRSEYSNLVYDLSEDTIILNENYEMVIHSAGKAHSIPKSEQEEKEFYDINYKGTINLCKSLESNPPLTFVFISTIAVYGIEEGLDIIESHPLLGNTPYAKSKRMAEEFLQKWCRQKEVNLVILRLPLLAGMNPKGNLETMINGIKKGYYFNISGNNALKSLVLADDVAKLMPRLYSKSGIYNLSGDKNYNFKQISDIIGNQLGKQNILRLPYFLVRISAYIGDVVSYFPLNSDKLKKMTSSLTVSDKRAVEELNWKPRSLAVHFNISNS